MSKKHFCHIESNTALVFQDVQDKSQSVIIIVEDTEKMKSEKKKDNKTV